MEGSAGIIAASCQEVTMNKRAEPVSDRQISPRKFSEMTGLEKTVFVFKAFVFLISGGFIYPTLWTD
jgi:hypothetical protein